MQNMLIKAHLNKEETVTELGQTKNKLFILQEKKISNENNPPTDIGPGQVEQAVRALRPEHQEVEHHPG